MRNAAPAPRARICPHRVAVVMRAKKQKYFLQNCLGNGKKVLSILGEVHTDRSNDLNIIEIQRLYHRVIYENTNYQVKITIKVIKNEGNKAYSYEVMKIESPCETK